MSKNTDPAHPFKESGNLIRQLREVKGMTRGDLAAALGADVSSVVGWESGKRLPRERTRLQLARLLGCEVGNLANPSGRAATLAAMLIDTVEDLPGLLIELTERAKILRALRLAAPYGTAAHVQVEWRNLIGRRLAEGALEVQRIEIFYDLRRLQEVLSNILRYDGRRYYVKSFCPGMSDVCPAMGGYFFDDDEFLLGAYWTGVPPTRRPGLRVSGGPFRIYFREYWDEIWRRGVLLNHRGAHDLAEVRKVALALGLTAKMWPDFVAEAKTLTVGDGAPPLV